MQKVALRYQFHEIYSSLLAAEAQVFSKKLKIEHSAFPAFKLTVFVEQLRYSRCRLQPNLILSRKQAAISFN